MGLIENFFNNHLIASFLVGAVLGLVVGYRLVLTAWVDMDDRGWSGHCVPGLSRTNLLLMFFGFALVLLSAFAVQVYMMGAIGGGVLIGSLIGLFRMVFKSAPVENEDDYGRPHVIDAEFPDVTSLPGPQDRSLELLGDDLGRIPGMQKLIDAARKDLQDKQFIRRR
jgi:hypothetical protein